MGTNQGVATISESIQTMTEDYDVVIDTLQKQYDILWKMTERNMNSEYIGMGIMDDIRLEQMDQLKEAIKIWKDRE
jgi:hypothetical protein